LSLVAAALIPVPQPTPQTHVVTTLVAILAPQTHVQTHVLPTTHALLIHVQTHALLIHVQTLAQLVTSKSYLVTSPITS
jgi:hypothetical protein